MKKQLTMTTAMASALLALPGCSTADDWDGNVYAARDTSVCVDDSGRRVYDENCRSYGSGVGGIYSRYYVPRNSPVPYYGDSIYDPIYARNPGSFSPQPGVTYASAPAEANMTRSQAISRGGLGSRGRAFGGGRS